jgi:hypothetical protein
LSRKPQDELTGNIEIENFFLLHGAFDQFLAGFIYHQDFPLVATGIADCVQYKVALDVNYRGAHAGGQPTTWGFRVKIGTKRRNKTTDSMED